MITITRTGTQVTASLFEDGKFANSFTCDRPDAIKLTNTLRRMDAEGKGFVAIRNMMQYDKI